MLRLILFLWCVVSFASPPEEARLTALFKELRCLVCQNQDLADSHAPLARDLRQEVKRLVAEGQTDEQIRTLLVARYGDFILFKPVLKPSTAFLWFGPVVFLILGLGGVMVFVVRGRKQNA